MRPPPKIIDVDNFIRVRDSVSSAAGLPLLAYLPTRLPTHLSALPCPPPPPSPIVAEPIISFSLSFGLSLG